MYAVILVAGRGTRMPEITKDKPKCLVEIKFSMTNEWRKHEE